MLTCNASDREIEREGGLQRNNDLMQKWTGRIKKKRAGREFFILFFENKKRGKVDDVFGLVVWWFGDAT